MIEDTDPRKIPSRLSLIEVRDIFDNLVEPDFLILELPYGLPERPWGAVEDALIESLAVLESFCQPQIWLSLSLADSRIGGSPTAAIQNIVDQVEGVGKLDPRCSCSVSGVFAIDPIEAENTGKSYLFRPDKPIESIKTGESGAIAWVSYYLRDSYNNPQDNGWFISARHLFNSDAVEPRMGLKAYRAYQHYSSLETAGKSLSSVTFIPIELFREAILNITDTYSFDVIG